jgi:ribosomal protein L40E
MTTFTIPPGATPMTCPKCGAEQAIAVACRKCGLTTTLMPQFREQDEADQPASVTTAWTQCELNWDDRDKHEKFVAAVIDAKAFPYAARKYRAAAARRPGDAIAIAQTERLAKMAEAALRATATQKPEKGSNPYKGTTILLAACIVALVFGLVYAMIQSRKSSGDDGKLTPVQRQPAPAQRR